MSKVNKVLPLNTTWIRSFWRIGYKAGGYSNIYAASQGSWTLMFWRFYWMSYGHSYQHFQKMAQRAFTERDQFARIAQEQADLNYLCAEYMKRRGLPPQAFKAWFRSKEAKKLMLGQIEKRKAKGAKDDE